VNRLGRELVLPVVDGESGAEKDGSRRYGLVELDGDGEAEVDDRVDGSFLLMEPIKGALFIVKFEIFGDRDETKSRFLDIDTSKL
jgi:hypothetical protein